MQTIHVRELAVALSNYPTVSAEATFAEAVVALQSAKYGMDPSRPKHRAVLVLDNQKQVVGKIGYLNLLEGLEPKYAGLQPVEHAGGTFTTDFIKSQLEKYSLWQHPLDDICRKAANFHVKNFMHVPKVNEFIDEEATLDEAVHQFIVVRHQSLLVRKKNQVVGILRLSDVVEKICEMIQTCAVPS